MRRVRTALARDLKGFSSARPVSAPACLLRLACHERRFGHASAYLLCRSLCGIACMARAAPPLPGGH